MMHSSDSHSPPRLDKRQEMVRFWMNPDLASKSLVSSQGCLEQIQSQGQRGVYSEMREVSPSEPLEEAWAILLRSAVQEDNSEAVSWAAWPED